MMKLLILLRSCVQCVQGTAGVRFCGVQGATYLYGLLFRHFLDCSFVALVAWM